MASLLIQKPQFDIQTLCPGTPVVLKTAVARFHRGNEQVLRNGIITKSSPLELRIEYWRVSSLKDLEAGMDYFILDVDAMSSGQYSLEILKPELDKVAVEKQIKGLLTEVQDTTSRSQEAYVNEVRSQIKVTARLLGIEPENTMPDLFKEALQKHEQSNG